MEKIKLILERPARKAGGDRYTSEDGSLTIYIPQKYSRKSGSPTKVMWVTFEEGKDD